jgi:hypothetical protein
VWFNGEFIDISNYRRPDPEGMGVMVIADEMKPTENLADGKIYTSKSKFRQVYKELGYLEVGNETKAMREAWKTAERETVPMEHSMRVVIEKFKTSSAFREEIRQRKENGDL